MTELNTYKTTTLGLYGNGSETYFVNKYGRMFCVQSPDLAAAAGEPIEIMDNLLPVDAVPLGDRDARDIEIPDWVYDAGAGEKGNLR